MRSLVVAAAQEVVAEAVHTAALAARVEFEVVLVAAEGQQAVLLVVLVEQQELRWE